MRKPRSRGPSLSDVRAIRALLQRYADAVDARDLDGVAACFAADAVYEGSLAGPDVGTALADLARRWQEYERTEHALGCQMVDLEAAGAPGRAHVETWVSVRQERRRDGRRESRRVVLRYSDDLVRIDPVLPPDSAPAPPPDSAGFHDRAGAWRIARRRVRTYFRLDWSPSTS